MAHARREDKRIETAAAGQGVGTRGAVYPVVGIVADNGVGRAVAGTVNRVGARQGQVFDIFAERVVDTAFDRVGTFGELFDHLVADVIYDIGVVAATACHDVVAGAAIETIIAVFAEQPVAAAAAIQRVIAVFAAHPVIAGIAVQRIVTGSAEQRVRAVAPVQDVGAGVPGDCVVSSFAGNVIVSVTAREGIVTVPADDRVVTFILRRGIFRRQPDKVRRGEIRPGNARQQQFVGIRVGRIRREHRLLGRGKGFGGPAQRI